MRELAEPKEKVPRPKVKGDSRAQSATGTATAADDDDAGEPEEEYLFEPQLLEVATRSIRAIEGHIEEERELLAAGMAADPAGSAEEANAATVPPAPPAAESTSSSSSAPVTGGVPEHASLDEYARYIHRDGRYPVVRSLDGRLLGEIQPFGGVWDTFKAVANCKIHSGRCSRMRGWRQASGENPSAVEHALAKWLVDGAKCVSKEKHVCLPRC